MLARDLCSDVHVSSRREWLVTNGRGGYASGTVAGIHTRRYHGTLVAALDPPLGRTLLVGTLNETLDVGPSGVGSPDAPDAFALGANAWTGGAVDPTGYVHLDRFHLEGTVPVWTYACGPAILEKRVWMEHGADTTYVRYTLARAFGPARLRVETLLGHRDHHATTEAGNWAMDVEPVGHGLRVDAYDGAVPIFLRSADAAATPDHTWHRGIHLAVEAERGLDATDDQLHAATFETELAPGASCTLVFSTALEASLDGAAALRHQHEREETLRAWSPFYDASADIRQLVLAADAFVVDRETDAVDDGSTILAGYPWFGDWGRDTMIALPGLTLATGRPDIAARILRTFAQFVDRGMIPNRFPDATGVPAYNTVDATLWMFDAVHRYVEATGDDGLLADLFPVLERIFDHHEHGTRYGIGVDAHDGLLHAGAPGVQLTWMDAKVDDWVVTPRTGKPVEVNALWHHALRVMAGFADRLGEDPAPFADRADRAAAGFARFWNEDLGFCYDVIDGPDGDDPALRPNQLLAVSLAPSPLAPEQQRAVVDACARRLLTPLGLRSLDPAHPDYTGRYTGDHTARDGAYHQGTVWSWLIGPFVKAHLRVYGDPETARSFLRPLLRHLGDHGLGHISEIFDGDPPFTPRGTIAQAWSVAEVLDAWRACDRHAHPSR